MKIGELSAAVGIPASAIRYYERIGLLDPPPRVGGARHFSRAAVQRLRFIRLARAAGYQLAEMRTLLDAYADSGSAAALWQGRVASKRAEVQAKIEALHRIDRVLQQLTECRCPTLEVCLTAAQSLQGQALVGPCQREEGCGDSPM